ncbi:MAG: hypothetical protein HQL40_05970 [Alphaproteobacteria bacterium]|nr:hypothetical protein [Alphaproteobacteria bacterium]
MGTLIAYVTGPGDIRVGPRLPDGGLTVAAVDSTDGPALLAALGAHAQRHSMGWLVVPGYAQARGDDARLAALDAFTAAVTDDLRPRPATGEWPIRSHRTMAAMAEIEGRA